MIAPEKLLEAAKALEPQLQEWRRTLHRHPEVGFDLPQTKALVKKALTEMGYTPQDCGKCGVLALAGGKKPGCEAIWTLCPCRRNPARNSLLSCPARCTAAATICTPPWCWVQPSCSRSTRTRSRAR